MTAKSRAEVLQEEIVERQVELDEIRRKRDELRTALIEEALTVGAVIKLLNDLPDEHKALPVTIGARGDVKEVGVEHLHPARFRGYYLAVGPRIDNNCVPVDGWTALQLLDELCEAINAGKPLEDWKGNTLTPTMDTLLALDSYNTFTPGAMVANVVVEKKLVRLVLLDTEPDE